MNMENTDFDKIYKAVLSLNKRLDELEQKDEEMQSVFSSMIAKNKAAETNPTETSRVLDEETVIADPYNFSGHRAVSMPNGGVIRVGVKPMCVNGSHILQDDSKVNFCVKCNSIVCNDHLLPLNELLCVNCVKDTISDFSSLDIYILALIDKGLSPRILTKFFRFSPTEVRAASHKLIDSRYLERDILFRYSLTLVGKEIMLLGSAIYDTTFLTNSDQGGYGNEKGPDN